MDINLLPLEILQKTLAYLPYDELKVASLVCRRWNEASETLLVRNGWLRIDNKVIEHFDVIRKSSTRKYQAIAIGRIDNWKQLHPVVAECIKRFPNARELRLKGIVQGYLGRFYQAYRNWMATFEWLEISLDDTFEQLHLGAQRDYFLKLPNLKKLHWMEGGLQGFGQKRVTINAPKLEYVQLEDGGDYTSELRITRCEQIKYIRATFYRKHFDDIFQSVPCNLETLILNIVHGNGDLSYLSNMPRLQYLALQIGGSLRYLVQELEAMQNSKLLKVLIIGTDFRYPSARCPLSLEQIFGNFKNLETLDLCGINLIANDEIQADQLVYLKLCDVTCSYSIFELNAPKLRTLILPVEILGKLRLNINQQLFELYLELESSNLKDAFDQILHPFLNKHNHIKNLTLMRNLGPDDQILDDTLTDRIVESVEHLVLYGVHVDITLFPLLAGWKSLKRLKLHDCTINCSGMMPNEVIRLPRVERMLVDGVELRGTSRTDFPIILTNGANQEIVGKRYGSTLNFTTHDLIPWEYKFRPFSYRVVEPLMPHWLL